MGSLGNKSVRVVGSAGFRLVENDRIPNVPLNAALKTVHTDQTILQSLHNNTSSRNIWREVLNSLYYKTEAYIRASNHFGVTTSYEVVSDNLGYAEVEAQIASNLGLTVNDITIEYNSVSPANNFHRIDHYLKDNFDYKLDNTLPGLEAGIQADVDAGKPTEVSHYVVGPIYLEDYVPFHNIDPLDESGTPPGPEEEGDVELEAPPGVSDVIQDHPTTRNFPFTRTMTNIRQDRVEGVPSYFQFWYAYEITTHYKPVPNPDYEPPTIPNPDYSGSPGQDDDPEGDPEFIANPDYDENEPEEITPTPTTEEFHDKYDSPEDIELADINEGEEHVHTRYTYDDNGTLVHDYFFYRISDNTYPAIDAAIENPTGTAQEYTVIPMCLCRDNWESLRGAAYEDVNGVNYRKVIFRRAGMDYDDLLNTIEDDPEGYKVWSAELFYGLPVNSKTELGGKYLWEFFNWFINAAHIGGSSAERRMIVKQPDGTKYDIMFASGEQSIETGTLTDLGPRYHWEFDPTDQVFEQWGDAITDPEPGDIWISGIDETEIVLDATNTSIPIKTDGIKIAKQLTANTYKVITMTGLTFDYYVGPNRARQARPDEKVLIPIFKEMLDSNFTLLERNSILSESYHVKINIRTKVRVNWYQRGFWAGVFIVIAAVLLYFSWGTLSSLYSGIVNTLLVGGATAAAATVIASLVVAFVVIGSRLIADWAIEELGVEWAIAIALVVMLVSGQTDGIDQLVLDSVSASFVQSGAEWYAKESVRYSSLNEDFQLLADEKMSALEELWDETVPDLDPNLMEALNLVPRFIPGESPDQFFQRTLMSLELVNLPSLNLSLHSDVRLSLPTLADSLDPKKK